MRVLTRRVNERIRIGESVVVVVNRVWSDRVSLGVEAPDDVLILRDELPPGAYDGDGGEKGGGDEPA